MTTLCCNTGGINASASKHERLDAYGATEVRREESTNLVDLIFDDHVQIAEETGFSEVVLNNARMVAAVAGLDEAELLLVVSHV